MIVPSIQNTNTKADSCTVVIMFIITMNVFFLRESLEGQGMHLRVHASSTGASGDLPPFCTLFAATQPGRLNPKT